MSKVIEATCEDGEVTALAVPVEVAEILSEGVAPSSGFILMQGDKVFYVAKTSPDLKTTLEKVVTALGKISTALTALDTAGFLIGATGAVPGTPVAGSAISDLDTAKTELETLKDNLR